MKFDVATFTSLSLIMFLCCALIATVLSRMFAQVSAFRFWATGFYLLAAASACFALHRIWRTDLLLFATAALALQSRILIWAGTRELFGVAVSWRRGLVVTGVFCVVYGSALFFEMAMLPRAVLLALFFVPYRAATLYEICRRRRPHVGLARSVVAIGAAIATLGAIVPLTLVLLDRANLSLLLGNPRTTSAVYAVVFAGDVLLASGLIVLAFKLVIVERDMLATLDRTASERLAMSRQTRAGSHLTHGDSPGYDKPAQRVSLPGMI
ncbi:hypothetical protein [Paraburkholderia rhynchosiae]|uniref:Uncharacterized protein n=1 Tax=Paraburkholderia rhynchosiae TaxID=487049 RepID=A0A2N7WSW5_9BURK|nr:hypothetical protein [Paraburkholderia rhynchosiae]PMS32474.1 hypothetical protein C0Z16_07690 [Paraburkholderia rhynchosiae]CAB3674718.1 hypothetical protein LMG27174_02326 [Paraburkholderia rhynchosiae]